MWPHLPSTLHAAALLLEGSRSSCTETPEPCRLTGTAVTCACKEVAPTHPPQRPCLEEHLREARATWHTELNIEAHQK